MIKTLSPYYIYVPLDNGTTPYENYHTTIFIWQGLKVDKPTTPIYEIKKDNVTLSEGYDKINISNLVDDYIEFFPRKSTSTSLINSVNNVWVSVWNRGDYDSELSENLEILTELAVSGYGGGLDGENSNITNDILIDGTEFKVNRLGSFIIPIISTNTDITIKSYPDNELDVILNDTVSTNSNSLIKYIFINLRETLNDTYIEVNINDTIITLFVEDEFKYNPIDVHFKNKNGVQQVLTFFKEKVDSIDVTNEQYQSNNGQPNLGFHQFKTFNSNGKSKFNVSSGFVDEEMNETFKQLLLSDDVWMLENDSFIPLNIKTTNLEYKTQVNNRLINYKIEFSYSFNEKNDI